MPDAKERILLSALQQFSSNGFTAATTREIAAAAGVNELTIFRNFGSKEGLLESTLVYSIDLGSLSENFPTTVTGDPDEDLYRTVEFLRSNMRKRRKLYRILLRDYSNPVVKRKLQEMPASIQTMLASRIGQILSPVAGDGLDLETASIFFMSYFFRSEIMTALMEKDPFHEIDERRTREAIRIFLNGVLPREGSD